ncbi:hypothetical protein [Corallococcus silvisoli]|uniref:hypothetical protein n=1 Tax=Corallococcus silvisoli TaxID=2697031 RepID=UPI0013786A24|nr:hypothetical protein [Corallococcus silvisoli]NBD12545.1 hypothetical protein [Corallococcus silvisoli]
MQSKTLHRWTLLGVCVATAAVVGPACNRDRPTMPRAGSRYQGVVNTQQPAPPGTGGSGTNVPTDAKGTPTQPQPSGAQGLSNQIGAPGYTSPNENTKDPGGARPFIQGHEGQQR